MVAAGVVLDARTIHLLKQLGVPELWIRWPDLDFLDGRLNTRVADMRDRLLATLRSDFESSRAKTVSASQYVGYCNLINALAIELLADLRNNVGIRLPAPSDQRRDLFTHSTNVTILSLAMGLRLEAYIIQERRHAGGNAGNLTNLGVGAMLHDLGKLRMPSTLAIHEPLAQPVGRAYRDHPRRGHRMISPRLSATARAVVLHHHQRFDGTGFPDMASVTSKRRRGPLAGRDIHIFPRIVAACDTLEHLCHDERGAARPMVAALHDLLAEDLAGRFDPVLHHGLLRHVPPFALGMKVTLSDGWPAAVIALNPDAPCRPRIQLLPENDGQGQSIDLAQTRELHIAKALGVSVEEWLYELPPAPVQPGAELVAAYKSA